MPIADRSPLLVGGKSEVYHIPVEEETKPEQPARNHSIEFRPVQPPVAAPLQRPPVQQASYATFTPRQTSDNVIYQMPPPPSSYFQHSGEIPQRGGVAPGVSERTLMYIDQHQNTKALFVQCDDSNVFPLDSTVFIDSSCAAFIHTGEWEVMVQTINETAHFSFLLLIVSFVAAVVVAMGVTIALVLEASDSYLYTIVIWILTAVVMRYVAMKFYQRRLFRIYSKAALEVDRACQQRQTNGERGPLMAVRVGVHWLHGNMQLVLTARQ